MNDPRSHRIVLLAHCLMNQNAKVEGLATHPGVFAPILPTLAQAGVGIVQLPCPELVHLGPLRPVGTDTIEQYDTPEYRACCRDMAQGVVAQADSYRESGCDIVCVLGVEGSPSCSVSRVPRLTEDNRSELMPGVGIFMEALRDRFAAAGLSIPFLGIPESEDAGNLRSAFVHLRRMLAGTIHE